MIRKLSRQFLLFAVFAALAGCSSMSFETKKIDYKSAGKLPPLEVPPDLTAPNRDDRYAVPDIAPRGGSATFSTYSTERAATKDVSAQEVLPQIDKMHIERSGSQRWLVVAGTPDQIWPVLKEFWQGLGFIVNVELPDAGIMETDWAENRAKLPQDVIRGTLGRIFDSLYSTPERDKFRTRIEKGSEAGTVEIYISHRGMYEVYANEGRDKTMWQPRPPDPELEAEMLRRLMVRLGTDEAKSKTLMAGESKKEDQAKLLPSASGGAGALQLAEAFDRSWRRVGLALDRVGFTVEDRDRTNGLYYVRYVDPEAGEKKSEGFLSKLKFWSSSKPEANQQFRILVKGEGEATSIVRVMTREGGVDNSETAKKILALLHEQLR